MQQWEQSYSLAGAGLVVVDQRDGRVRVVGRDQDQVQVRASWSGEVRIEQLLDVRVSGNRIDLEVKPYPTGLFGSWRTDSQLDLELFVPRGTECRVDSGSGPVSLEDTFGPAVIDTGSGTVTVTGLSQASIDTSSGAVQVRQINGPVNIDTGSGRVALDTVLGPASLETGSGAIAARRIGRGLKASTGSGSITVADVEGRVELEASSGSIAANRIASPEMAVETGSGSLRLQVLDVRSLTAETGSGSMEVELVRLYPDATYRLETGSGRVGVVIPPDAGLRLELETHGRIDYGGLPVQLLDQADEQVTAQLGSGEALLTIATGSGRIALKPGQLSDSSSETVAARLAELEGEEPAQEQGDPLTRVLQMVRDGRLSAEEAEEIVRALEGEEAGV